MRGDLASGAGTAVELLGDPRGAVGVAGEQDDRGVVLGFGAEVDLRHELLLFDGLLAGGCPAGGPADASPNADSTGCGARLTAAPRCAGLSSAGEAGRTRQLDYMRIDKWWRRRPKATKSTCSHHGVQTGREKIHGVWCGQTVENLGYIYTHDVLHGWNPSYGTDNARLASTPGGSDGAGLRQK